MPSLYESTVNTGEVSSSNFTTLYNASGLSVPNAGAGSVTGNLNVGGNLTVQGNTLLVGEVTLQSTLSLPNYTFPSPDGTTFQVLATDGNGNLYWSDVSAIPGADYNISATTATGGANLTLANTAGFTDSVKFAAGTNIGIVRTDANTITISTVADNIPDGTARGQVLYWDGSAWTANSTISASAGADRLTAVYENNSPGVNNAIFARKDYTTSTYTTGDGTGIAFQLDSNTQVTNQLATIAASWNASAPIITLNTNINNNTLGPFVSVGSFTSAQATLPGDLAVNGGDITTTQTTASLFNTTATTVNIGNGANTALNLGSATGGSTVVVKSENLVGIAATQNVFNTVATRINLGNSADIEVNIGSPTGGSKVVIKPETIVGINTTQAVFNTVATTVNAFGAATNITIGVDGAVAGAGTTTIRSATTVVKGDLAVNGDNTGLVADITTTKTAARVFDTNALTIDAFGAATAVNIGAATGVTTIEHDLTVNGGNINLNGQATAATQPFITFEEQSADAHPQYGIRGRSSQNDPWFIGAGSTGDDLGYLEIATGDNSGLTNSGGQIYVRQYNGASPGTGVPWYGGNGTVVNEFILLDNVGDTSIPNNLTVGDNITLNSDKADVDVDLTFGRLGAVNAAIRWNKTTDSFEWSADGTTWYDFINADLTAPFYNGQLLSYLNGEWINENRVITTDSLERNAFVYRPLSPIAGFNTSLYLRKDYSNAAPSTPGVGTYADGAGVALSFQVVSDTQAPPSGSAGQSNQYASVVGVYSATVPQIELRTSIDNGSTNTLVAEFDSTGATLPNDLAVNGNDLTTTQTTFNLLNATATTLNIGGAATATNIGSTVSGTTTIGYDLLVNNDVNADSYIVDSISTYNTQTTTTTVAGTPVQISGTTRVSQKAIIKIIDNVTGEVHMLEALAFRSGTTGFLTTYAEMYSSVALATFTVTGTGGVTSILANPISSNSTTFTVARISLD